MKKKIFKVIIKTKFMLLLSLTSLNAHANIVKSGKYKASSNFRVSVKVSKNNSVIDESSTNISDNSFNSNNLGITIPNEEDEDLNIMITQTGGDDNHNLITDDHGHCFETDAGDCNLQIAGHDLDLNLALAPNNSNSKSNSYEVLVITE